MDQTWFLSQDLGPGPHHYISLYHRLIEVARFNRHREEWHDKDELIKLVRYLNQENPHAPPR